MKARTCLNIYFTILCLMVMVPVVYVLVWRDEPIIKEAPVLTIEKKPAPIVREKLEEEITPMPQTRTEVKDLPVLAIVNDQINATIDWVEDTARDHWQTFDETRERGAGDCEDFAIAKYTMLRHQGVDLARLRLAHVREGRGGAHMVLFYMTDDGDPWVLDNKVKELRRLSARRDLSPVYTFDDQDLYTIDQGRPAASSHNDKRWVRVLEAEGWA